ncbi:MAG: helix-turn-helix domain-containing protein [Faecousia sp.]
MLFNIGGCKKMIQQYCLENRLPGFCSDIASLIWLTSPQYINDTLTDIYIVGPVFSSSTSEYALTKSLLNLHASQELVQSTRALLKAVPVVPHTFLMQYGLILHRCLTGAKLETADIQIIAASGNIHSKILPDTEPESHIGTYALERQIFQAVEDGNIDYIHPKEVYQRHTGTLHRTNPLRNAKNEIITCITLITRAAIRGGMPEESAYSLSDYYILLLEDSSSIAEVYQYSQDAFKDFTSRVHKYKMRQGRSKEIQDCISYLELHLGQKVTMTELSSALGYNKNYLSTKFAKEVGMTISDYLLKLRIDRAKLLLHNSGKPIQQISDELGFNSVSYFSAQFRKATGKSPSDFRNRKEK